MKMYSSRSVIIFCTIAVFTQNMNAQIDSDFESTRDRYFFGGNIGLAIGSFTDIEISPLAGYYITKRWAAGVGLTYEYYKRNDFVRVNTHIYGWRVFSRLFLFPDLSEYFPVNPGLSLFAHGEYSGLSLEESVFKGPLYENSGRRFISNNYLFGGGLMRKYNKRAGMYFMVLFLLNDPAESPFSNPEFRIGLIF